MSKKRTRKVSAQKKAAAFEFNPDYTHVKQDLKRIGLLAGIFTAAMIVLSFFIG